MFTPRTRAAMAPLCAFLLRVSSSSTPALAFHATPSGKKRAARKGKGPAVAKRRRAEEAPAEETSSTAGPSVAKVALETLAAELLEAGARGLGPQHVFPSANTSTTRSAGAALAAGARTLPPLRPVKATLLQGERRWQSESGRGSEQ